MGSPAQLRHPDLSELRIFRVKNFERMLVLYRPRTDGVEILRVVHASRNLLAFFRREGIES